MLCRVDKRIVWSFALGLLLVSPVAFAASGEDATHASDHEEDVLELPEVHVHGLSLNKNQQLGPVAKRTPWPISPAGIIA